MGKKHKQVVWHKKRGKFLPPSTLKPRGARVSSQNLADDKTLQDATVRKKIFWRELNKKIHHAVAESMPQNPRV